MCGRFSLYASPDEVALAFSLPAAETSRVFPSEGRFNIAPTTEVVAVRLLVGGECWDPVLLRWGLVPQWTGDPGIGARMINARAETVAVKPTFREAFLARRCLVIADGFFEWQKLAGRKQPYYFRLLNGEPFAFAGLWECCEGKDRTQIESCTIITTQPNDLVKSIHNRMPVILDRDGCDLWLDPTLGRPNGVSTLLSLLRPFRADGMTGFPVSSLVNKPANDEHGCIEPIGPPLYASR